MSGIIIEHLNNLIIILTRRENLHLFNLKMKNNRARHTRLIVNVKKGEKKGIGIRRVSLIVLIYKLWTVFERIRFCLKGAAERQRQLENKRVKRGLETTKKTATKTTNTARPTNGEKR